MALGITRWDCRSKNAEPEHTLNYCAAQPGMGILELENRCTGNRTVGSNPTLSARMQFGRHRTPQTSIALIGFTRVVAHAVS
jgi:hypothetical protein